LGGQAGPATTLLYAIIWDASVFRAWHGLRRHVQDVLQHQRESKQQSSIDSSPLLAAVRRVMLMGWLGIGVLLLVIIIMSVVVLIDVKAVQLVTVTVWLISLPVLTYIAWVPLPRPIRCGGHVMVVPGTKNAARLVSQRFSSNGGGVVAYGNGNGATSPTHARVAVTSGGVTSPSNRSSQLHKQQMDFQRSMRRATLPLPTYVLPVAAKSLSAAPSSPAILQSGKSGVGPPVVGVAAATRYLVIHNTNDINTLNTFPTDTNTTMSGAESPPLLPGDIIATTATMQLSTTGTQLMSSLPVPIA
jgi:hypothetical protein